MDRRAFLGAVAGASGFAGCSGLADRLPGAGTRTANPTTVAPPSLAEQGVPATICDQEVVDIGIYAVGDPTFAPDWSGVDVAEQYAADGRLTEDAVVVGVSGEAGDAGKTGETRETRETGEAGATGSRAYPLTVLWYHEIVNDSVPAKFVAGGPTANSTATDRTGGDTGGEVPLLVTYCPICRSGMVAERRVAGKPSMFDVSGQLWQPPRLYTRASEAENRTFGAVRGNASEDMRVRNSGNLVMVDEATGSFWSQVLARAICGPRRGEELRIVPSTLTTWGEWRATHEDTDVLLPPPHSGLRSSIQKG